MKAVQVRQYGGAETLQLTEVARPTPGNGEVLIAVKAAALNPVDSKIRNGYLKDVVPVVFPYIPGFEAAGIIAAVGEGVGSVKVGDEVITRVPFGRGAAYAEYMLAGENEVVPKPTGLSFTDAATLPIAAGAAYTVLFKVAQIQPGWTIVILGAGGAVGRFAVQMAQRAGATVIDYKTAGPVKDADLALDFAGLPAQNDLWTSLKTGGQLLSTVMPPDPEKAAFYHVNASFVFTAPDRETLETVAAMAERGEIKTAVGKVLPLAEAAEAQRLMDEGSVKGKIVLSVQ